MHSNHKNITFYWAVAVAFLLIVNNSIVFGQNNAPNIKVEDPTSLFEEANALYQNENFEDAINLYESILGAYESPELYLNLGNSYYKSGQVANAIYFYEKALKIAPNMEAAKTNLAIANQLIVDNIKADKQVDFSAIWYNFLHFRDANFWSKASLLFLLLACIAFLAFKLVPAKRIKQLGFYGFSINLLLTLITVFFAWQQTVVQEKNTFAIIFESKVDVKSAPTGSAKNLFILHNGSKVKILTQKGEFAEIKLADGNVGWVPLDALRII
ncbi:MAG: tetratricopeptide repeat protein [Luteibaculaceae bacterium]